MANGRGKERPGFDEPDLDEGSDDASGRAGAFPDLMRRALSIGFSGFFMTEEAVRRALGERLPKDWVDFAVEQSDRTRAEFLERLSFEIGQALEHIDLAAVLSDLLEGRTLEVKAEIRLGASAPVEKGKPTKRGRKARIEIKATQLEDDGDRDE